MPINENKEFQPLIVAFCCNWCSYAGADLSGTNRLDSPTNVKMLMPCKPDVHSQSIPEGS